MLACIILGMGLPTTANYVVTATMAAPALVEFGVPVIAAHMFVFYFGIVADITPPVSLAAYAGAGIAGANPMKTGVTAVKIAIGAFIFPYMFVYYPVLLLQDASFFDLLYALPTAIIGMMAISASMIGYFILPLTWIKRILFFIVGIFLIATNIWFTLTGLVILGALIIILGHQKKIKNNQISKAV